MSFMIRRPMGRQFLAVAVLAAASLAALSACASTSEDQAQQQQAQPQAAEERAADQQATASSDQDRSQSSAGTIGRVGSSSADQQQAEAAQPAQDAPAEQQSAQQQQEQQDDGMGGMQAGMSVAIVEEAAYDDLSPRLQLLADSGYPVYVTDRGYTISLGTPDLSPGVHRVSVVIEGPEGLVETPAMRVTVLADQSPGDTHEVIARFSRFPDGIRGFHVTSVDFSTVGRWNLILHIPSADGFDDIGIAIDIPEATSAPSIGDAAPASASRTLTDVGNIADLSTGETPDPGLYLISLADAVEASKPFVVVFASPGFCTNAFCGPQAEVLSEVRSAFGDQANYIHVDLYENPEQVRFGEEPIETPILEEWGLHTDEWTFIVNADGVVVGRFEAFAPFEEVEAALAAVLEG